jgi:DNA-binding MarR family transcriptional regulator
MQQRVKSFAPANDRGDGSIRFFRSHIRVLEREIERSLASETGCCGVTLPQCHLLLEVEEKGETGVTELAAALELDKSTLSRAVDGLWREGLVSRETDPTNRRRQVVTLTPDGRKKALSINSRCDDFYARLFKAIPAEKRVMIRECVALLADAMRKTRKKGCS